MNVWPVPVTQKPRTLATPGIRVRLKGTMATLPRASAASQYHLTSANQSPGMSGPGRNRTLYGDGAPGLKRLCCREACPLEPGT